MSLGEEYHEETNKLYWETDSYNHEIDHFTDEYVEWLEKRLEKEMFDKNIVKLKVNDLYMYLKGGKE